MLTQIATTFLRFYRRCVSPMLPPACRYYPSCSQYSLEAFERYGFIKGAILSFKRLLRCQPLFPGGYDPVP